MPIKTLAMIAVTAIGLTGCLTTSDPIGAKAAMERCIKQAAEGKSDPLPPVIPVLACR